MLKAVLFDLDETLVDRSTMLLKYLKAHYERYLTKIGVLTFEAYRDRFVTLDDYGYYPKEQVFQRLIEEFNLPYLMEELLLDFRTNYPGYASLYPGAMEVLATLKAKGYALGIITNGSVQSQRAKLAHTNLISQVDVILISEEVGFKKPEPDIFRIALERLGVRADEAVFIGDNPGSDIVGGNAAGLKTVWYENHIAWSPEIAIAPDYTIHNIAEALTLDLFYQENL